MPIRAGSGGLKYALPNRSETQARQNAAAASAGGSASATAYSANRRYAGVKKQLRYGAEQSAIERSFRAQQSLLDKGFQAQQSFFDRRHEKGGQLSRQAATKARQKERIEQENKFQGKSQTFTAGESKLARQHALDRDKAQSERKIEAGERKIDADINEMRRNRIIELSPENKETYEDELDEFMDEGLADGSLEISPEDAAELRRLGGAAAYLKTLDPAQQADFKRQQKAHKRRILRTAKKRGGRTAAEEQQKNLTHYDPKKGMLPGAGPNPHLYGKPLDTGQFHNQESLRREAKDIVGKVKPNTQDEKYTYPEAVDQAIENQRVRDRGLNPPASTDSDDDGIGQEDEQRGELGADTTAVPGGDGELYDIQKPPVDVERQGAMDVFADDPATQKKAGRLYDIQKQTGASDISEIKDPKLKTEGWVIQEEIKRATEAVIMDPNVSLKDIADRFGLYVPPNFEGEGIRGKWGGDARAELLRQHNEQAPVPEVKTPEEAGTLLPGTEFIDSEGKRRRAPTEEDKRAMQQRAEIEMRKMDARLEETGSWTEEMDARYDALEKKAGWISHGAGSGTGFF